MNRYLSFLVIAITLPTLLFGQQYERYKKLPDSVFNSQYLGYSKHINVTVPKEYQTDINKTFPLIIIFDTQNERSFNYMLRTIDYLTSNEQMPASIIIGVESLMDKRFKETDLPISHQTSLGDKNERFIFEELIPLANKSYKASNFTVLIGHSRYGYFSTYLLTKKPEELNAVISISPFYNQKNMDLVDSVANLYKQKKLGRKIYYMFSAGADFPEDFKRMETTTQYLMKNGTDIEAKGYIFPEADHNATPGLSVGIALYQVFELWTKEQEKFLTPKNIDLKLKEVVDKEIYNHYGKSIGFSLGVLNGKGWQFFNEKKYADAIVAWDLMLAEYPNFSEGYLAIIQAQKSLGVSDKETIERFIKNLEQSDFYTAKDKMELTHQLEELRK